MGRPAFHVLLVEDDRDDAFIVRRRLEQAPTIACELTWKTAYQEGLEALCSGRFDAALVDYRLGARTGLDLLKAAVDRGVRTPLILLTGQGNPDVDRRAMQAGAADYLTKANLDAPLLERALRHARERARSKREIRRQAALLDEVQDAICTYDLDGRVTYWNEGARRMTGYAKEEVGTLHDCEDGCLYGADRETVERAWQTVLEEGEWTGEIEQTTKSGDLLVVESQWTLVTGAGGEPEAVLVLNTDITEKKRLEQQALRSQRMESIGRLASGIAHDLGNLLVPIQLGVSVLRERFPDDERAERSLRMIEKSAERGSDMAERVLSFAQGTGGERRPLDLAGIVEEVEDLVEESFSEDIAFESILREDLPPVRGDATQLQQVLVNLSVNARDAMPEGGRLLLEARPVELNDGDARLQPTEAEAGSYVHVGVEDTGTGIPSDVRDKIFEPFFSTKSSDDGTGLGLSTVYSIVTSHGGLMNVQSTEGEGTRFNVFLPAASPEAFEEERAPEDQAPPEKQAPAEKDAPRESPPGDGSASEEKERVLIIDDEAFIRESAEAALESCGYRPLTAAQLGEAHRLLDEHAVDAILTDGALEDGPDGLTTAVRALKSRCPEVPVVVCSSRSDGYPEKAREAGAEHFLAKPFDAETLREALGTVLRRQAGPHRQAAVPREQAAPRE
jgi:PAS domain S-box-containing protein